MYVDFRIIYLGGQDAGMDVLSVVLLMSLYAVLKERTDVWIHTCQHLCPLEKVLGADLNGLLSCTGSAGRAGHLAPLRVLCSWHWCLHEDRQMG